MISDVEQLGGGDEAVGQQGEGGLCIEGGPAKIFLIFKSFKISYVT